jgi:ABC-type dipeptide/oligopeptide/nickel transport system permease component
MRRWLLLRLLAAIVTLVGITFVTFVVLDASPVDRAQIEVARASAGGSFPDVAARDAAVLRLRLRYGMVDPVTMADRPVWRRYVAWLDNALHLRFAGPGDDHEALWRRLAQALPVTVTLSGLALLLAFGLGLPLGVRLGEQKGSRVDRVASGVLLAVAGVPEFLLAMLLVLTFGSAWLSWFPIGGLSSPGAEDLSFGAWLFDAAHHAALPVLVLATGPLVLVVRFVRDAVARASQQPFVVHLRALGVGPGRVRRRMLRYGAVPVATLLGALLPMLVGGSVVVENVFALDGLGHLALAAALGHDTAMVMALTTLSAVVTLAALVGSDLVHRVIDPRVRLAQWRFAR